MNAPGFGGMQDSRLVIDALPVGIAVYDDERRLILSNAAFSRTLGLPASACRPLSTFADLARLAAHRGLLGPGDAEQQASELGSIDTHQEHRFRRRHPDGHTFDAHYIPLATGGHMICLADSTAMVAARQEAEHAVARIQTAVSGLHIGIAVFSPAGQLELYNRRFPILIGVSPDAIFTGMRFDDLVAAMRGREAFVGAPGELFPAGLDKLQAAATVRRERDNGQVIDIQADPLPDGGWSLTVADVTPKVRAEDDATRHSALLHSIVQQVPHGISVYGADQRLMMVNDAYRRIMEGAPGTVGDTLQEIVTARLEAGEYLEPDPEGYARNVMAVQAGLPHIRQRRRPNGSVIDVRTAALPDGGHITVVTDVTPLSEAKSELERRASLLASIVSHVPHGISVYGADRRLRLVNEAYGRIMDGAPIAIGETIDEIIDRRAREGEYGGGETASLAAMQRRYDNAKPQFRRRHRPNGRIIEVRTAPLPDGGHLSVVTDITPLASAQAELARRAETLGAMLANIRHGIILWDEHRRIVAANDVVASMLGAPPNLLVPGRTLEETIDSALERGNLGHGETARRRAVWLAEQDRSRPHHDQRLTRDGRVLEVRTDPTPGGGFVTTYTDVTQVREAEEALLLSKSAAEAANAAKSRFLAAMSSELRSPLTTILAQTETIARSAANQKAGRTGRAPAPGINPVDVAEACSTIDSAAHALLGLIDTILDVTRLEAGRFDLIDETIALPVLLRSVLRRFDPQAAAAEVALVVDLPLHLPMVRADKRRLGQVISNVILNAMKFAPASGSISIAARHDWASGGLVLSVTDTGPGIAEADLARAFEPFTQIARGEPPGNASQPGAGLGLYVGRILMRAHGGDLTLRSTPGQGTIASLTIPAERVVQDTGCDTN